MENVVAKLVADGKGLTKRKLFTIHKNGIFIGIKKPRHIIVKFI